MIAPSQSWGQLPPVENAVAGLKHAAWLGQIAVIAGPTGSGKKSLCIAAIEKIRKPEKDIKFHEFHCCGQKTGELARQVSNLRQSRRLGVVNRSKRLFCAGSRLKAAFVNR